MDIVKYLFSLLMCSLSCIKGQPLCTSLTDNAYIGINMSVGTVISSLSCTCGCPGSLTYTVDYSINGSDYFSMSGSDLKLVTRLDVEYGNVKWDIHVIIDDGMAFTATATVSLTTYQSTTTTTSTRPPPGYSWFKENNNKMLFWSVMGLMAIIFATCVLLCFRFHKKGRCLPKSWPSFEKMKDSFNRQVACCPLPFDFEKKGETIEEADVPIVEEIDDTPFGLPPRKAKKTTPVKEPSAVAKPTPTPPKPATPDVEDDRSMNVTPLVIGNVQLNDVGFDGMRSPGFNAPMFTSYGGKKDATNKKKKF